MLKKPSILLSSYGNLYSLYLPHHTPIGASSVNPQPQRPGSAYFPCGRRKAQWRTFAQLRSEKPHSDRHQHLPWPDLPSATAIPNPYQIFQQKKNAPYSKHRFYELVKLYHPDRHGHEQNPSSINFLSEAVKMERYRLVVAANDILSDPAKRSAYDRYGAGWNGRTDSDLSKHNWSHNTGTTRWSGFHDNASPAGNATWEDWERWYQRDARGKQEPVYFSNGGFLSLIVIVVALGSLGQATRVGDYSRTFLEQIEAVHDDCSKSIQHRRKDSQGFGSRDERLQSFLRSRDQSGIPLGYGVTDPKEESYRRLLSPPEA